MDVPNKVVIPWDVNQGDFYKHMDAELFNEDEISVFITDIYMKNKDVNMLL